MGRLLLTIFVGLLILLGIWTVSQAELGPRYDPAAFARAEAEIARYEAQVATARALAPLDLALAAAWRVLPLAVVVGGLVYLASLGVAHLARFRRERMPRADGLLPVLASQLGTEAPRALGSWHGTRQLEAQRQPVPHTLTYAPREDYRANASGVPVHAPDVAAADPAPLPGVLDLADVPHTPSVQSILLAVGPGGAPVTVPMKSLWHIAMAGPTGNGKSNIARMVVAQLQAIGAKVCVGDPKWTEYDAEQDEDWRPIARRLHREPAYKAREIGALLAWAAAPGTGELDRRLELRRQGEKPGGPLFLYLDELPWIAQHVDDAERMIGDLVRVGRGVGLFLLVGAQDMLAKSVNLSAERENFRTGYYLGGDVKSGSILLGIPQREVSDPAGLGLAWLRSSATTPPQEVRVPYASNRAIYRLLPDDAPTMEIPRTTPAPQPHHAPHHSGVARQDALNDRQRALLAAMARQAGNNEILHHVYGADTSRRGPDYKAAVEALRADQAVIARAMGVQP